MNDLLKAAIMGVVEGLTEFIPVSSTGHLIIAGKILNFTGELASTFEVFIQMGAILAVVILYRERFLKLLHFKEKKGFAGVNGIFLLSATTVPALLAGLAFHGYIKENLFNTSTVAIGLGVGGVALLAAERFDKIPRVFSLDEIGWKDALLIGLFQCLALWPGTSRAAATIIGAMLLGFDRKTAVEYSFFAAVPVICAASLYDLLKNWDLVLSGNVGMFAVGFAVSFIAAWFSIRIFVKLLSHFAIEVFAWYRIAIAPLVYFLLR